MRIIILALAILAVQACNDEEPQKVVDPDVTTIKLVYANQRVPVGFYEWFVPDKENYYITSHLKDSSGSEISVSNYSQARDIESSFSGGRALVNENETEIYYEFVREDQTIPNSFYRTRLFKDEVIDRAGVELNCTGCYWGRISSGWLERGRVKDLIEYMWYFTLDNNDGIVVLESVIEESAGGYLHVMTVAKLKLIAIGCDEIDLYMKTYSVDIMGDIWKDEEYIRTILSNRAGICKAAE